jgi:hypothetical protein
MARWASPTPGLRERFEQQRPITALQPIIAPFPGQTDTSRNAMGRLQQVALNRLKPSTSTARGDGG